MSLTIELTEAGIDSFT